MSVPDVTATHQVDVEILHKISEMFDQLVVQEEKSEEHQNIVCEP